MISPILGIIIFWPSLAIFLTNAAPSDSDSIPEVLSCVIVSTFLSALRLAVCDASMPTVALFADIEALFAVLVCEFGVLSRSPMLLWCVGGRCCRNVYRGVPHRDCLSCCEACP